MPSIRYTFTATGHQTVVGAFKSIGQAAGASARMVQKASRAAIAAQNKMARNAKRSLASTKAAQEAQATRAAQAKRDAALVRSLGKEKAALAKSVAQFEAAEKKKTATVAREGSKRVATERRNNRRASGGGLFRGAGRRGGRFFSRVGRSAGSLATIGLGLAAAGGIGAAVRENIQIEDHARDIAIRGRDPQGARIDPSDIAANARRTAMAVPGVSARDVLSGTDVFLERTGDLDAAQKAGKIIAELAQASGTDMRDMANAAASLFDQFGVGKTNMEDMREQLSRFILQGKKGAFEMKDLSKGMDRLGAAARILGTKGDIDQVAVIGGLAQFSRKASGGPARAVTALEGAFNVLSKKELLIKKRHGFDVSGTANRDLASVLPKLFEAIGGDKAKFENIFEKRSKTGVIDLFLEFKKLEEKSGSLSQASAELTQMIREKSSAEGAAADVTKDLADAQQKTSAKITELWETVLQNFTTEEGSKSINELLDSLITLAPTVSLVAEAFEATAASTGLFIDLMAVIAKSIPGFGDKFKGITAAKDIAAEKLLLRKQEKVQQNLREVNKGRLSPEKQALVSASLKRVRGDIAATKGRLMELEGPTEEQKIDAKLKKEFEDKQRKFKAGLALGPEATEVERGVAEAVEGGRIETKDKGGPTLEGLPGTGSGVLARLLGIGDVTATGTKQQSAEFDRIDQGIAQLDAKAAEDAILGGGQAVQASLERVAGDIARVKVPSVTPDG